MSLVCIRLANADHHEVEIDGIFTGVGSAATGQYVEIRLYDGNSHWVENKVDLVFRNGSGLGERRCRFLHDPVEAPPQGSVSVLVATADFALLPGVPAPDFIMDPMVYAPDGQVCFHTPGDTVNMCLSYGSYSGGIVFPAGPPAPPLRSDGIVALQRIRGVDSSYSQTNHRNADFDLVPADPHNSEGAARAMRCSRCGDGAVDEGEDCDDGNEIAGDCCSPACKFEHADTPCTPDGDACTIDTCDEAGTCRHDPNPCGVSDPLLGCVAAITTTCEHAAAGKAAVNLASPAAPGDAAFAWRWSGAAAGEDRLGDTTAGTRYTLCLYEDGDPPALKLQIPLPAQTHCETDGCWESTGKGFKGAGPLGDGGAFKAVLMRAHGRRGAKIKMSAKGEAVNVPALPSPPLRVQLKREDGQACWDASFVNLKLRRRGLRGQSE